MLKTILNWFKDAKKHVKTFMLPVIILYFIRTMFIPTFIDVLVLFILFLIYVGALLEWY
ncbi:hypothetical protein AB1399_04165 [Hydrogenibacillus schlegelii]|uniref:Uncharacterized protein n=1 Tax=Hydrogenibacillus schlegelii TaxID=1484 RepID=A0A2T5GB69_HYDSH|nr:MULTISPECIES: hypothetical protein [Hydrogenibacillus]MBE3563877.1 hypothetical protein [Hydrogenibacillus schlegelii]MBT9282895.1 hypothetical protein [Hydrogenibacillus schlegelii]PTQ53434.1 MAG: hypothetical protein HSCHL_2062 [Hydrogenibacillus schlegelii]QZA33668.1 hypothetical protein K2M58_03840 [Hydrogenibacillus sp. N12]